jgi:SAM-dependent methyltransferase
VSDVFAAGRFPVCPATHDQGLRWLFDLSTVLLLLDCRPGDRVLDLGAGSGFSSEMLARLGYDVVALDPDRGALANNRRRPAFDRSRIAGTVTVAQGVAEGLPFANRAFDGAVCMNVLHHLPDLAGIARELARVLKPGCRVGFCEPGLDHLQAPETVRAVTEHGEQDRPFDAIAFLRTAQANGFREAMLSATLQSPLRLLPVDEIDLYRGGRHPRPHLTPDGVLEELHRRHAYGMLVRDGEKPKTSRHPGRLAAALEADGLPSHAARGAGVAISLRAVNTGDTVWLAAVSAVGGSVSAGCKLLTVDGRLIDDTLGRTPIDRDVAPGGGTRVDVRFDVPRHLTPGRYLLRADLVDEFVCWFSDLPWNTAPTVEIDVS